VRQRQPEGKDEGKEKKRRERRKKKTVATSKAIVLVTFWIPE